MIIISQLAFPILIQIQKRDILTILKSDRTYNMVDIGISGPNQWYLAI